ncbi:hypothetical protein [Yersinia aleksiciae]|nr:hypothetical protein [Yersinia aleksiciae]
MNSLRGQVENLSDNVSRLMRS